MSRERASWAGGSPPPKQDRPAGWGRTAIMAHVHWFEQTRSLCGKWVYTGPTSQELQPGDAFCQLCALKLRARREPQPLPGPSDAANP